MARYFYLTRTFWYDNMNFTFHMPKRNIVPIIWTNVFLGTAHLNSKLQILISLKLIKFDFYVSKVLQIIFYFRAKN